MVQFYCHISSYHEREDQLNRQEFQSEVFKLSPLELRIREGEDIDSTFYKTLEQKGLKDKNGYYLFPRDIKSLLNISDIMNLDHEEMRSRLFHSILQNRLRLIINNRFSHDRLHYDAFIGINYVYSGQLIIHFPDHSVKLQNGQLCLMGENVVHSYEIRGAEDIILSMQMDRKYLDSQLLYGLSGDSPVVDLLISSMFGRECSFTYSVFSCTGDDRMKLLFEDLFCEYIDPGILSGSLTETLIKRLFILLIQNSGTIRKPDVRVSIAKILKYIEDHYQSCTLDDLAREYKYTPKYISRLIRQRTGRSFSDLVLRTRLDKICYYLANTNLPIQEIAINCGYSNQNFFYRKFKETYQMMPSEYRKKNHHA